MSQGIIFLVIAIAVLLIVAYLVAILLRRRNENILMELEERKEALYSLPVNDEVEEVKNLHLIGQSQVAFREWNQKWVDLSLNSFADIENHLFEAEGFNNSFRFFQAKTAIKSIESQIDLIDADIKSIRQALAELKDQENKNSGRVLHALDLFENLQLQVQNNREAYGRALPEIEQQLHHIENEFSRFVSLNSSGDPVEAAEILDKTEDYILALTHIVEKVPALTEKLDKELPDQLDDLETGYRRLLEAGYHFTETDIESRFQQLHAAIKTNNETVASLELDNAEYENTRLQEEIDALYAIFTREMEARKRVEKISATLPSYLEHTIQNNDRLQEDILRLSEQYQLADTFNITVKELKSDLNVLSDIVLTNESEVSQNQKAFSELEESLNHAQEELKSVEEDQLVLGQDLAQIEKDDANARQKVNIYVNKLHTIKRYMEKRNFPGIPQSFLSLFFTASQNTEDLMDELEEERVNIDAVNRMLDIVSNDMMQLEDETYRIVQDATLTEQLLQYSNRYRSFDERVQEAFHQSLEIFERDYDYATSFETISQALELVEPGVTERFVTSYEKTRETIRF